jgi:hypothetical protein
VAAAAKPGSAVRQFVLRVPILIVGCLALAWGVSNLGQSLVITDFWDVEAQLMRFETFSQTTAARTLESAAAKGLSACDTHSQRALLLMEIPLAGAGLRSGAGSEFDRHMRSLETRTRQILSCSPRDSFAWLTAFGLETQHGLSSGHSFDLLAMSYETSPREAWLALRRIIVAVPLTLMAPEPVQAKILDEYQDLIRHRFFDIPARVYLNASPATQALLQTRIDQLDPTSKRHFSEELDRRRA